MAGNWSPDGAVAGFTVGLEFDGPDGHVHPAATYSYDAATGTVTVKSKLLGEGKPDTWTGKPAGEVLELAGGELKLKFKKGGKAHGH
jgi:hypothetical protein